VENAQLPAARLASPLGEGRLLGRVKDLKPRRRARSVIIMINRHPPVHIFAAIFGGLEKVKATCPVFLVE